MMIKLESVGMEISTEDIRELRVEVLEEMSEEDYDLVDKIARENNIVLGDYDLCNDYDYGYGC